MTPSKCPNCGHSEFYRRANVRASGVSARLLPNLMPGLFDVLLCKDCGLIRLFASHADRQAAEAKWESVSSELKTPVGPLGL